MTKCSAYYSLNCFWRIKQKEKNCAHKHRWHISNVASKTDHFRKRKCSDTSHVFSPKLTIREDSRPVRLGASLVVCTTLLRDCRTLYFCCRNFASLLYVQFGLRSRKNESWEWRTDIEMNVRTAVTRDIYEFTLSLNIPLVVMAPIVQFVVQSFSGIWCSLR